MYLAAILITPDLGDNQVVKMSAVVPELEVGAEFPVLLCRYCLLRLGDLLSDKYVTELGARKQSCDCSLELWYACDECI